MTNARAVAIGRCGVGVVVLDKLALWWHNGLYWYLKEFIHYSPLNRFAVVKSLGIIHDVV